MKKRFLALLLILVLLLGACTPGEPVHQSEDTGESTLGSAESSIGTTETGQPPETGESTDASEESSEASSEATQSTAGSTAPETAPKPSSSTGGGNADHSQAEIPAITQPDFDYASVPAYSGTLYTYINGGIPSFTENQYTTESYEYYSPLDTLGRCGVAVACVGKDIMPADGETRGNINSVKPSGWVQAQYDCVSGRYLYNRSHLIGWQLTAENANKQNLITGSKDFNVKGMLPFENMVADYLKEYPENHVLYRVTPIFVGSDLVARGVHMEAWSVEDEGDGICYNVFIYNVQPGVVIDYATGSSYEENPSEDPDESTGAAACDYVLNTSSKKFHDPDCRSAANISDKNRKDYTGSREALIVEGYLPCGICKP